MNFLAQSAIAIRRIINEKKAELTQPRVAPTPQRGRPKSRRATSDTHLSQGQQQISSVIAKLEYADVIKPMIAVEVSTTRSSPVTIGLAVL